MNIFKTAFSFAGWAPVILWELCLAIDSIIYRVAEYAIRAFFQMAELSANVQAYSTELGYILNRVMLLAGIYALFRLAVMLINYLIDPAKLNEASKNSVAIIKSIIIAVVLLVSSEFIFKVLGNFQRLISEQQLIPKLVYGADNYNANDISSESRKFVNSVFLLFFEPNSSANCNGSAVSSGPCAVYADVLNGADGGAGISSLVPYASSSYFDYLPFISGIAGFMLIYYFVVFSIDLASRIVRLAVLQVISPIPIIMSMDPSQKNRLTTFIKAYGGLYAQVFIRILTVYLAFVIIDLVKPFVMNLSNVAMVSGNDFLLAGNLLIVVLLYFGVFQAAKELPKLLEDALGVKMGNFGNAKSFGGLVKTIVGGGVGLVGGAVLGGISGGLGGALAGAGSGVVTGALGVGSSKNAAAGIKEAISTLKGSYALGGRVAGAGGFGRFMLGGIQNALGGKTRDAATLDMYDKEIKDLDKGISGHRDNISKINGDIEGQNRLMDTRNRADQLRSRLENAFSTQHNDLSTWLNGDEDYKAARQLLAEAKSPEDRAYANRELASHRRRVESSYNSAKERFFKENFARYNSSIPGARATVDSEFLSAIEDYNKFVSDNGLSDMKIGSYQGARDGIDHARLENDTKKHDIQTQIDAYKIDISREETDISTLEISKAMKEKQKENLEKDKGYISRNKRDEKPKGKPRR